MTSIEPIMYEGKEIVPLQFLKAVLPIRHPLVRVRLEKRISDAFSRVRRMEKRRSITYIISVIIRSATKRLVPRRSPYTTGVPAMIGAMLVMNGTWQKPGVYNIEEFDPDPFMDALNKWGLPWKESWDPALVD